MSDGRDRARTTGDKRFWLVPYVLSLVPFLLLATLNSSGYRYGASDQAFYVPAVLEQLDPARYPDDSPLIESQARLTAVDEAVAAAARTSGLTLPVLFVGLYVAALAIMAWGATSLASAFYRTRWAAAGLLAALTLRHAITKSGTNTLEGYFHPRQLAFALGTVAVAGFLRGQSAVPAISVAVAAVIHPTTAVWFGIWLGAAAFVAHRRWRPVIAAGALVAAAAASWALLAGPLQGRLVEMDAIWLETLRAKDYLFPIDWPLHAWLINLAYAPLIVWLYFRRRAAGALAPRETALVLGCLSLLAVFAAALVLHSQRLAIAIQLQPARTFWMLDFLATVYVVWALCEWPGAGRRRAVIAVTAILFASITRSAYIFSVHYPERGLAQIEVRDDDWGRAMTWARRSEPNSQWLADPLHAARYGTSVRVAGERDVFVEEIKDSAIGIYDRSIAMRTHERLRALGDFRTLTRERALALASRYGLEYLVTEQPLNLPVAFRSRRVVVYRLR